MCALALIDKEIRLLFNSPIHCVSVCSTARDGFSKFSCARPVILLSCCASGYVRVASIFKVVKRVLASK